jgi:hypothetical protein
MNDTKSLARTLVEGLIIGAVATQALDWVSTALYENEDRQTREDEDNARAHMHAYEVAIKNMTQAVGIELDREGIAKWGWRFHKSFGYFGGIQYILLRKRFPRISRANGLVFGTGFFVFVDELMMPMMKWTPGPTAFSWKVHARGAIAHIAYGVTAETTARLLDQLPDSVTKISPLDDELSDLDELAA